MPIVASVPRSSSHDRTGRQNGFELIVKKGKFSVYFVCLVRRTAYGCRGTSFQSYKPHFDFLNL